MKTFPTLIGLVLAVALFAFPASQAEFADLPDEGEPMVLVHTFDGQLVCQARSGVPGCPNELGQRVSTTFPVRFVGLEAVLFEMQWEAGFPAVVNAEMGLSTIWNTPADGDGSAATDGPSVLRLYVEKGADNMTFCLEGCPGHETRARAPLPRTGDGQVSTSAFVPLGKPVVNQEFTIFVSFFVNGTMPDGYSAIPSPPPSGLPGAPQSLSATPSGLGRVALAWQAPAEGPTDAYRVYRASSGAASGLAFLGQVAATQLTYTDVGCARGTVCTYTVAAVNALGQGAGSNPASTLGTA